LRSAGRATTVSRHRGAANFVPEKTLVSLMFE
jgi:hypothetical protein